MKPQTFFFKMISCKAGEHCDLYPYGSYQHGQMHGDLIKLVDRIDFIQPAFKTEVIEVLPDLKECSDCKNKFAADWKFIKDEEIESCIRCYARRHVPGRSRDQFVELIKAGY